MHQVLLSPTPNSYSLQTQDELSRKHSRRNTILLVLILIVSCLALGFSIRANYVKHNDGRIFPNPDFIHRANLRNIADVKGAVAQFYETKEFAEEVSVLMSQFDEHVTFNPQIFKHSKPPMVVFDIDETLVNNYPLYKADEYVYKPDSWEKWVEDATAAAIQPVVDTLTALVEQGANVVLITGRREVSRDATVRNLNYIGITDKMYHSLVLRSPDEDGLSASEYKMLRRKGLAQEFSIVGCVGDQYSDCAGGYTGNSVKLPNYMYFIA